VAAVQWTHPACPACAATGAAPVYRLRGYEIARCRACGLLWNACFGRGGPASEVFAARYYLDQHAEGFAPLLYDHRSDLSLPAYEHGLDQAEAALGRGRLLDVGAGFGTFLRVAQDRGWQAAGVEISRFAAAQIRERHGIEVFLGDLAELPAADGSFDLITFWDALEHVERPRGSLERAWRLLRPGGMLLLTTDNFDCLIADLAAACYRLSAGAWTYPVERIFIDRNVSYFSAATLTALVQQSGFEQLAMTRMEYPLGKIKANFAERLALRLLYALAAAAGRQAQLTLTARRPERCR
jgi:SAM-dependent methyltransferase